MEPRYIVPGISVDQRLDELYAELVAKYGASKVHKKILRGFGQLVNNAAGPKIQLSTLQGNRDASGVAIPAQILLDSTDGYVFPAVRISLLKAASTAAVKNARKVTYADFNIFPAAGTENVAVQSFYSAGLVKMTVNSDPAMQPLALSYFENEAGLQSGAAVVATNPRYNDRYQLLDENRFISGGSQNYFEFDLTGADTTTISPSSANWVCVETVGYVILGEAGAFSNLAKAQCNA